MEHEVAGFTAIPEALEWVKINSFDILVSDYHLGKDFHAHDLLKAIRAIQDNTFKSFVLTNHIDDAMKAALMGAGFSAVIEKPLSLDKFKSATGL